MVNSECVYIYIFDFHFTVLAEVYTARINPRDFSNMKNVSQEGELTVHNSTMSVDFFHFFFFLQVNALNRRNSVVFIKL